MGGFFNIAEVLKNTLELQREPVGVKFFNKVEEISSISDYEKTRKMRYCQAVMLAGRGEKIVLSAQNISCAAAGAAFGIMPLHPKLASGEGHYNTGVFGSKESAGKVLQEIPRIKLGTYNYIALGPLGEIDWTPDIIVIEAHPEAIMWLLLADINISGTRLHLETSVIQACCVDATVVPLLTGKTNASFGCTGCREASDLDATESVLGFPIARLDAIITNLQALQEKTIPKNRKKPIFERFASGAKE